MPYSPRHCEERSTLRHCEERIPPRHCEERIPPCHCEEPFAYVSGDEAISNNTLITNVLTIDLEDWFQVENFKEVIPPDAWDKCQLRIVDNTFKLLALLERRGAKATFFVLGWIAAKRPRLIQAIRDRGHEIATHGFSHRLIHTQSRQEFKQDLEQSIRVISGITGQKVRGFRAPTWSINQRSLWALEVLEECGLEYDSSIFPIRRNGCSMENTPRFPYVIYKNGRGAIMEYPLSTVRLGGKNIPFSGGGYLRLLPYSFIKWSIQRINQEGHPAIIYLHPWELDPHQPRQNAGPLKNFRHYVNLDKTEAKLNRLLRDFRFSSIEQVLHKNSCCEHPSSLREAYSLRHCERTK